MKIKVVANYDSDLNIYKSVINCFGEDKDIKLTLNDEEAKYLFIINGYNTSKIKHSRNNIFGLLQEPIGNANYDRNLSFYCSKIFCQSSSMFNSYKGTIELPVSMFYSHHINVEQDYFTSFNDFGDRKKICIIVSAINSPNNLTWNNHNYDKRHKLIQTLLKSDLDFDFYGRGWSIDDSRYKGEIKNKHDILRKYEYSIAIENVCEKNYASEKIFDCFLNNTVPLYYGCPNISEIYDENSFETINIESGEVVNDIKKIISKSNLEYKNGILNSKKMYFSNYNIYNFVRKIL